MTTKAANQKTAISNNALDHIIMAFLSTSGQRSPFFHGVEVDANIGKFLDPCRIHVLPASNQNNNWHSQWISRILTKSLHHKLICLVNRQCNYVHVDIKELLDFNDCTGWKLYQPFRNEIKPECPNNCGQTHVSLLKTTAGETGP